MTTGADGADMAAVVACLGVVAVYLRAAALLRRRGDTWPPLRDVCFSVGGAGLAVAVVAPPVGGEFTSHMIQHLVIGMIGPLLLVLGRPVTLALRAVPAGGHRSMLTVLHSAPAALLVWPPVAALLDVGGLWALYRTPLLAATHHHLWLHAGVHLHVFVAGVLFAFAIRQLDPLRRRPSLLLRSASLIAAGAGHGILAKTLYAAPPPDTGYSTVDVHTAAELMYYGGDVVEIALAIVLALQWYTTQRRDLARVQRRTPATKHP